MKFIKVKTLLYETFLAQLYIITYFTLPTLCEASHNVGKTTTTVNLGTALARQGKKVLLIDLDPQANLTMCMGQQKPDSLKITIANIFAGLVNKQSPLPKEEYLLQSEGCDIIPSSILLANIEPSIINATARETLLRRFLKQFLGEYDYILIDCLCAAAHKQSNVQ